MSMLRLQNGKYESDDNVTISSNPLLMDSSIWENCKNILNDTIQLIPVKNIDGEVVAYAYQNDEANRELRMLKELRNSKDALQFTDIFPEYQEVVIYGCNELAVSFTKYLEEVGVTVSVIGEYWSYFGYTSQNEVNLLEKEEGRLIIYAEGIPLSNFDIFSKMQKSVSPEFECIDKIYEENVKNGSIKDVIGDLDTFIWNLQSKKEIIVLGTDRIAQDAYDLLMKHGIDICCFAVKEQGNEMLLGKTVMGVTEALQCFQNPVFLNCKDTHSALGEEWTEYFDYRGYERNKQYFLIRDYTDIPTSNLVHVLRGRRVLLTGDKQLCKLLSDYLYQIENDEVTVQYVPLSEKTSIEKDDILCLVIPDYYNRNSTIKELNEEILQHQLSDMGFVHYTKYFIDISSFVLIDGYLNRDTKKYIVPELTPKGILIGRIPQYSGNVFFRGVMDGHPEILCIPYSDLNENLFYYCVRLANCEAEDVLHNFWVMYDKEAGSKERYFPLINKFETSAQRLLSLKAKFTSQELFVLFHIAYAEMLSGKMVDDITKLVIYWEPHFILTDKISFFALWLEDEKVNGQTIVLRRNNIIRTGSTCARIVEGKLVPDAFTVMFLEEPDWNEDKVHYHHWTEFKIRFEDIKTNPKEKLMEICERFAIKWSDNMLQTTTAGKPLTYRGSVDFDLKAVFNQYDDYLSEFDRFRISIASSPYQKQYGFIYENCLKFSRRELQEMFSKPFLFEENFVFKEDFIKIREKTAWRLWKVRKHFVLDDVHPELDRFELKQTGEKRMIEYNQEAVNETIQYIMTHHKLIIYGIGRDCQGLLKLMDEDIKERFLYSDKQAETKTCIFLGKRVIPPQELCNIYKDYAILVTSSLYRMSIKNEFDRMEIDSSRVFYNRADLNKIDIKA